MPKNYKNATREKRRNTLDRGVTVHCILKEHKSPCSGHFKELKEVAFSTTHRAWKSSNLSHLHTEKIMFFTLLDIFSKVCIFNVLL